MSVSLCVKIILGGITCAMMTCILRQCFWALIRTMDLLDDVEFFDCMDTCPDVFSLLDESDFNLSNYPSEELFSELTAMEEPVCCHRYCVTLCHYIV